MNGFVYLKGLKQALERFNDNGKFAKQGYWTIGKGAYDLDWQLAYQGAPVIDCVNGKLKNDCLSGPMFRKCASVIKSVYPDVICENADPIMGTVIKSGTVTVKKPFTVKFFDEDDGWVSKDIKPGDYEYRVQNVRGWKPRQLKVDGEWFDVMGDCEELEELLSMNESIIITRKADVKALPHGTLVRISGTGVPGDDGDYYVDQESQAPGLVSKKDSKRKLYFNAKFDRRIQDMLRQGVKFDVNPDVSETTTVSNVSPTVDYLGNVRPVIGYLDTYDDVQRKQKEAEKERAVTANPDWVPRIVRLLAGESVRSVVGECVGLTEQEAEFPENFATFTKIDSVDAIADYPGTLICATAYPHKNTFGLRLEDPEIKNFFKDRIFGIIVEFIFKPLTAAEKIDKIDSEFFGYANGKPGVVNAIKTLSKDPDVIKVSVHPM